MRLYELVPAEGYVVVHHEGTSHTHVLLAVGALYDNEDTDDLRNMSICFGLVVRSDKWRIATPEEVEEMRSKDRGNRIMSLQFNHTPPKRFRFRIIK